MKGFLESLQKRLAEIDKELNPGIESVGDADGKQSLYSEGSQGMKDPYGGFQFSLMTPTGGASARRRAEAAALGVDPEAISQAAPKQPTPKEGSPEQLQKIFPGQAISQGPRPPEIFFPGVNQMMDQAGQQVNVYEISSYFPSGDVSELSIAKDPVLGPLSQLMKVVAFPFTAAYDVAGEVPKQLSRVAGLFDDPMNLETRAYPLVGSPPFGSATGDMLTGIDDLREYETPTIPVRDARFKEQSAKQMGEFAQAYKDFQSIAPQLDPVMKGQVGQKLLKALDRIAFNLDSGNVHPMVKTNLKNAYYEIRTQIINDYLDGVQQPETWSPTKLRDDEKARKQQAKLQREAERKAKEEAKKQEKK